MTTHSTDAPPDSAETLPATATGPTAGEAVLTPHAGLGIVVVGHVDHGKSTLIGRLLHDTGALPDGKLEELQALSRARGMPLEWSFVLDAFKAERDQAITIDTTQIWFRTRHRDVVIIDAPGHHEFLKNMVSGAAHADAAILVVDAAEGVAEQTRRHAYILHLLGLRQVAVAINKMDLVGYDQERFETVRAEVVQYLAGLGVTATHIVPISAREGVNLSRWSEDMPWYGGECLLDALDDFRAMPTEAHRPLRLPIQDVYKFDERRILVGRIEAGRLQVGDALMFSPRAGTAIVRSIEAFGSAVPPQAAEAGDVVGITLDTQIFVERGDVASHADHPPMLSNVFRGTLFWIGRTPLKAGAQLRLKLATRDTPVLVQAIERVVDTQTLAGGTAEQVHRNEVAEVVLRTRDLVALDPFTDSPVTGRFVLVDGYDTVAGGLISMDGYPDQRRRAVSAPEHLYAVDHLLNPTARAWRNGHLGAVIWFTGLSGAGKSTLAMRVEQRLFDQGCQVYVLDGDNVRKGLNGDLGFSPEDRVENIRRVGEAAALFADAGLICITAFISPYRADRDKARMAAPDRFHEIYIKADLDVCEQRDPKGLYKLARAGKIKDFTGVSAPYEPPESPDLVVDTAAEPLEACVDRVIAYILQHVALAPAPSPTA